MDAATVERLKAAAEMLPWILGAGFALIGVAVACLVATRRG